MKNKTENNSKKDPSHYDDIKVKDEIYNDVSNHFEMSKNDDINNKFFEDDGKFYIFNLILKIF